jgi:hypothetical protein
MREFCDSGTDLGVNPRVIIGMGAGLLDIRNYQFFSLHFVTLCHTIIFSCVKIRYETTHPITQPMRSYLGPCPH